MKLGKLSLIFAAGALAAAPVLAQAALAPTVAPLDGDESEISQAASILIGVIAAGAVVAAIVVASGDDEPISS